MKLKTKTKKLVKRIKERIYMTGGAYVFKLMNGEYTIRSKGTSKVNNLLERGAELTGYYDKNATHKDIADDILNDEGKVNES